MSSKDVFSTTLAAMTTTYSEFFFHLIFFPSSTPAIMKKVACVKMIEVTVTNRYDFFYSRDFDLEFCQNVHIHRQSIIPLNEKKGSKYLNYAQ